MKITQGHRWAMCVFPAVSLLIFCMLLEVLVFVLRGILDVSQYAVDLMKNWVEAGEVEVE